MKVLQEEYNLNQKDCYATITEYGLSIFQNKYNPDLKRVKTSRTADFYTGTKKDELIEKFGTCEHFFDKQQNGKGGRKEVKLFGDKNRFIAAIGDNAEFFNLSASDMAQIVISHALVQWDKLPADFKVFFEGINQEFKNHVSNFYCIPIQAHEIQASEKT